MPFTKKYIFGKANRQKIKRLPLRETYKFQIDILFEELECIEAIAERITEEILKAGSAYYREIEILTSMKGISVFTAIAIRN